MNEVSVWLIDVNKHDHSTIRWSVMRSTFPVDLDIFHSADAAISALEVSAPPRVIITDMKLPGMSGIEFLQRLKQSRFSTIPVVVRCDSSAEEDIAAAYQAGANAYVIKAHDLHLIDRNISGIAGFFGRLPPAVPAVDTFHQVVPSGDQERSRLVSESG